MLQGTTAINEAEVLDADAFAKFKENGIFDQVTAQSFRDNVLSRGGSDDPASFTVIFVARIPQSMHCLSAMELREINN